MQAIKEGIAIVWNILMSMNVMDVIDIAIIAFIFYRLLTFARKTSVGGLVKGIIVLICVLWVSDLLDLTMINYLLERTVQMGVIALIVLFQPEIRKFLTTVGSSKISIFFKKRQDLSAVEAAINHTVAACVEMSKTKTGALIVFENKINLDEFIRSGTPVNATTSTELFLQIFYPNTPLHDGAVIIRDGIVSAAGCMLPMSTNTNLSRDLGMRHRAAIGITERTDAISVIVSEETGAISVAVDGMLKRRLTPDIFETLLRNKLVPDKETFKDKFMNKVKKKNG